MKNTQVSTDTLNKTLPVVSPVNLPRILEDNVGNFCPVCGKTIFSNLLEINGKVYLEKNCCTKEFVFMENNVDFFRKHKNNSEVKPIIPNPKNYHEALYKNPNYDLSGIELYVTAKCNMECPICYIKYDKYCQNKINEMSVERVKEILKKYSSQVVYLLGGEPTMREDIGELIRVIRKSRNIPSICTNALKLQDKSYVKKLKEAGLRKISMHFDGFNKAANIKLRGKDYLNERIRAIKNINEIGGFRVGLVSVIDKEMNVKEIPNILRFARENNINGIYFVGLKPPEYKSKEPTTLSDLVKAMEEEGYFSKIYFLETVKMYRNLHKIIRRVFKGTLLEKWAFGKTLSNFNVVFFKKESSCLNLLFSEKEVKKINNILINALNKKNKTAVLFNLLSNSISLVRSPLKDVFKEKYLFLNKTPFSSKLIQVDLQTLLGPEERLIRAIRKAATYSALPYIVSV